MRETRRRMLTDREREFLNQLAMIDEDLYDAFKVFDRQFISAMIRSTDALMRDLNQTRVDENNGERTQAHIPIEWSNKPVATEEAIRLEEHGWGSEGRVI